MNKILIRILFIVALIIAIGLLAIVLIRYTPRFFSYVSSAGASLFNVFKKESLQVEVSPQTVTSGERVILSWTNEDQESVSLTYVCNDEYVLSYLGGNATRIPVRCGEAFELGGTVDEAVVIPALTENNEFDDIEIRIDQERSDGSKASGIAIITVVSNEENRTPASQATSTRPTLTTTSTSTVTRTPSNTRPSTGGSIIVQYPTISGPANLTIAQPYYVNNFGPAVQFIVSNNGGRSTGAWTLRASLPNGEIFNSGALASIPSGGSTIFTLNLGTVVRGTNTVRISVDPNNAIIEGNEGDNVREVSFTNESGSGTPSSGRADLTVKLLSIGHVGNSDDIGIRFEIRNIGGSTAEDWRFEAELPTEDDETYRSSRQPDLKPGESIEYTLRFNNAERNGYATIEADSDDDVRESEEDNNRIRFRVTD